MVNNYIKYYGGSIKDFQRSRANDKNDYDILREQHRFVWEDDDDNDNNWDKRLAKKYYDRLYKEYCVADLSKYKENKIALRWRIEREVIGGKGQFLCGNLKCGASDNLRSWEVNFGYVERGEKKNALVKLRLCPKCSDKLNYHHRQRLAKSKVKADNSRTMKKDSNVPSRATPEKELDVAPKETGPESSSKPDNVWSRPVNVDSKTREDEIEDYFEDMLL
ncbi:uncharacterized protein TRIADDRAFT_60773 [Trichoplax adhaerens]|uniref:Uncharacterized protein n=1 Tax=Trichoplax adhaerens TaxID=10228 RepID=B3S8X1_TRIAD|nr:hypothetical protein TRIADDRAFT_60773 [Trichoplax adhaerens]EDV20776.1 hypothetical protein TRIADDRAFT_60773 [Trichoplax adhaerens]|eukprot:XP_002116717.1 hypothetical protein TRIADDRAFT_60773 [Trichoplax adhaerens]